MRGRLTIAAFVQDRLLTRLADMRDFCEAVLAELTDPWLTITLREPENIKYSVRPPKA